MSDIMEGPDDGLESGLLTDGGDNGGQGGRGAGVPPPPDDEGVGYKRPPRQHQFPPGRSGNPRGRPRGAKGLKQILQSEFSQRMRIMEGDKPLKVSKLQLIVKRELEKAMAGDQRAIEHVISLNIQMFGLGADEPREEELTLGEQLYLEAIMKRLAPSSDEEAGHPTDPNSSEASDLEDEDEAA
ncbi:MAG: DUF5681 domain-containing protein [Acidobacteriota bacterium]|nr:DUF5681 domain-containing protein [Acidobacteriota bacterium]